MTDKEYLEQNGDIVDPDTGEVVAMVEGDRVVISPGYPDLSTAITCMNAVRAGHDFFVPLPMFIPGATELI